MKHRSRSKGETVLPTDAELPILDALWWVGEGTVEDIVNRIPSTPPANYKTVQSLLRIMENKGFVQHKTRGRAFVFTSCVTRDEVARASARRLIERNFQGSHTAMLMNLLDSNHIKEDELDELERLIQRYRKRKGMGGAIK
jgi:BlaI family transcriptional regulator, penicillinase repressor